MHSVLGVSVMQFVGVDFFTTSSSGEGCEMSNINKIDGVLLSKKQRRRDIIHLVVIERPSFSSLCYCCNTHSGYFYRDRL